MALSDLQTDDDLDARIMATARGVIEREARALAGVPSQLDEGFAALVRAILLLPGKVITTGTGTSGIMAERLAHLLAVSGTPAFYLPCLDALHGGIGAVTDGDLVIALSKGGRSEELIQLTRKLVDRGIPVVAVTERPESPFALAAQRVALLRTEPVDADPGGLIAMGSTLVAGAWGDALAATLMRLREHSWRDVVDIHPGGYVGAQTELPDDQGLDD
jgi:arabinose-5-phosphate isomerase